MAIEVFRYQAKYLPVYKNFIHLLNIVPEEVNSIDKIPFLPIEFFKTHRIISDGKEPELKFSSSGTTGSITSSHLVANTDIYDFSARESFRLFYGDPSEYCFLGLLPSYLERKDSSLIYMVNKFMQWSEKANSGFYLNNRKELVERLKQNEKNNIKTFLIGVTYALLDLAEEYQLDLKKTIVCETGGMKGRRKEMIRSDVHTILKDRLGVLSVHSEYGMTELLSQAWSSGNGIFNCPPWMRIQIKDLHDPFASAKKGKSGVIHVIDLANVYSCAFIKTSDLG